MKKNIKDEKIKRKIIKINKDKCTGCGDCIPNCPEGALQIIDGKAVLISDLFCDGLGACIGHCPFDAITVEERIAEPYDEKKVMKNVVEHGNNVIIAHLKHLKEHNDLENYNLAVEYLKENNVEINLQEITENKTHVHNHSCPGSKMVDFSNNINENIKETGKRSSQLKQWPVQMHLISPYAPYYKKSDLVIAADCVAYALADFHKDYLKDKSLAIACPKLDSGLEVYKKKIEALIDEAEINTLTVMIMQVPCCRGLLAITQQAMSDADRKVPLKCIVIGIQGEIIREEWL